MDVGDKMCGGEGVVIPTEKSVRHQMPLIPTAMASNPRMAISKASAKELISPSKPATLNAEDLKMNNSLTVTPSKEDNDPKPPSSMPTPPSDGAPSEPSPKGPQPSPKALDQGENATPAFVKHSPENRDNTPPESVAGSQVAEGESIPESEPKKTTPRAKTKDDIKKQLMKKKGQKNEAEKKEEVVIALPQQVDSNEVPEGCLYILGDMFWGKVSGHPWWPCMIAHDPFEGIFFKTRQTAKFYHVQFFGEEGERGWLRVSRMEVFAGVTQHFAWLEEMSRRPKMKKEYAQVNSRRRPAWDVACQEAEEAFSLSRADRRARFTLTYSPLKPQAPHQPQTTKTIKRKLSITNSSTTEPGDAKSPPKKKRKRSTSVTTSASLDSERLANQPLTQFAVFSSKKRDGVRREHPTYTDAQIEGALEAQWEALGPDDRAKFIPMGNDVKHVSQMMEQGQAGKRTPKPSKKKMESQESGGIVKNKRRSSVASTGSSTKRKSESGAANNWDSVINSVAAGAGTIPETLNLSELEECGLLIDEDPHRKKKKRKELEEDEGALSSSSKEDPVPRSRSKLQGVYLEDGELFEPEIFNLVENPSLKKELVCAMCEEQAGDIVACEGSCCGNFHLSCLGLKKAPTGAFKCDECSTGNHTCFVCKKAAADLKRCSSSGCGKFFHENCVKKFNLARIDNGHIYCPLHMCATCAADNPKNPVAAKGRLYRCVRCPTAYHTGDFCVAAGSIHLGGYNIVCSRHFQPVKTQAHHSHVNVSWCFSCSRGGSLLCCETCPASFHIDCLKIDHPEGAWYCRDCASGKKPLYGDIVWVKIGMYRWWPGEICHPRNVPMNIQDMAHQVGEFPVRFFGSRDYFWMHQARVFLFQEGDKGCKEGTGTKSREKVFQKAVKEATLAYNMWKKFQDQREEKQQQISEKKPAPYKHIKMNQPVGSVTIYKADPSEIPRCECSADMESPCGEFSDCINRMTLEECHPMVCPAGSRCHNQRFQKREYPEAMPVKTVGRGWGLRVQEPVKKGQFVSEYVGELIDEQEGKRRFKQAEEENISNFYMLTLDTKRIIDAGPKGNLSRFMNHSCEPNCVTQKWTVNGDVRVGLFANQDIGVGMELTFNYNLDCLGNEKKRCCCGAPSCSGFLGVKVKKEEPERAPKLKKKKKHKKPVVKATENDCYRCGDGGELVMCDKTTCPKVYHLKCLKLNKLPHGKWLCPWHHCDVCGKSASRLCSECPNSFCHLHLEGNIFQVAGGQLICEDHEDILAAVQASKLDNEPAPPPGKATLSSSEATSTCSSSPAHSDSDDGGDKPGEMDMARPEIQVTENSKGEASKDKETVVTSGGESEEEKSASKGKAATSRRKKTQESKAEEILETTTRGLLSPKQRDAESHTDTNRNNITSPTHSGASSNDTLKSTNSAKKARKNSLEGKKDSLEGKKDSLESTMANKATRNRGKQVTDSKDKSQSQDETSDEDFPNLVIDLPQ